MTREEVKQEILPILQAFVEGKEIQRREKGTDDWCDMPVNDLSYISGYYDYRIKPEPKYRPFKNQEECLNELQRHIPYGFLENKESGRTIQICGLYTGIQDTQFKIVYSGISINCCETATSVYYNYKFKDGTPFGIIED